MKTVAILIPTRNRPEILRRTLKELRCAGLGDKPLIVYDDASENQDVIGRMVRSDWPHSQFIRGTERKGQAAGRNLLLRACPCDLALCLDDDSFPEFSDWIGEYLRTDWRQRRLAVATFQYKRLADGKLSINETSLPCSATGFLGGASMVHVSSILSVGGYRDFFVYGYEEPELALRLRLAGFAIWQDPRIVILHNHFNVPQENRNPGEYDYLYARNGVLLSSLNLPLPLGLPRGIARSLRRALTNRRNAWAKTKGIIVGIAMTFARWNERTPCSWRDSLGMLYDNR